MTLQSSGPISLNDIADEFGLSRSTPFPSGFHGLGGAPGSGALSFADFYGRSNFTLSADRTNINAHGFGGYDQATITSAIDTTFSFSGASPHCTGQQLNARTAAVTAVTPGSGDGDERGTLRVTASNGDAVDIFYVASWGVS